MDYWDDKNASFSYMFKARPTSDASSLKKCQKIGGEFLNLFFLLSAVPLGETSIDFYESLPAVLAPPITTSGKCFNMY